MANNLAVNRIALRAGNGWRTGFALLATAALVAGCVHHSLLAPQSPTVESHAYFRTLPPDAKLPSGAQCARWVRASPTPEIRPGNNVFNHTAGQHVGTGFFPAGDSPQARTLAPRINGDFTGTTSEILRWAACKWGIDQNIVFAQAAAESSWRQTKLGDWGPESGRCPPGHGIGADRNPAMCPQSYGILQVRYPFWKTAWPGIGDSTAMNADVAYAVWRSCYDGYERWLGNTASTAVPYRRGELWGCVGRWFAGSWYTAEAGHYVHRVRGFLRERIWEQPAFVRAASPMGPGA